MTTITFSLEILPEDIDHAKPGCATCPAARALLRTFPEATHAWVGYTGAQVSRSQGAPGASQEWIDFLPSSTLETWIRNYDAQDSRPGPATFTITATWNGEWDR